MPRIIILFAKVLFAGTGAVDIRGKIGGTVFSKSRSGPYIRNKVTPVNPRTSNQQTVRSILAFFSQAFRTLTAIQIAAWNEAANNGFTGHNIFGNTIRKTGHALFVSLNTNLNIIGVAQINSPPLQAGAKNMESISPVASNGGATLFLFGLNHAGTNTVPAGTTLVVSGCAPVSAGISFVKSKMRIFTTVAAAANTDTTNLWAAYIARFGTPPVGAKIFIGVNAVNLVTGETGIPLKESLVVAA